MWKSDCQRKGLSVFDELLKLVGDERFSHFKLNDVDGDDDLEGLEEAADDEDVMTADVFPCLYCPQEFSTKRLLDRHQPTCRKAFNFDVAKVKLKKYSLFE